MGAIAYEEQGSGPLVICVPSQGDLRGEDAPHAARGLRSLAHGFATLQAAGGFGLPLECDESFHRLVAMLTGA